MKKIIKILILIILISILVFFTVTITRKFIIFNKISNRISSLNYSNYYCKFYTTTDEKYIDESHPNYIPMSGTWKSYKRLDDLKIIDTPINSELSIKEGNFTIAKDKGYYSISNNNITVDKNFSANPFYRWNENKSFTDKLNLAINSKINSATFNNQNCYEIILKYNYHKELYNKITIYIDKETLLKVGEKIEYDNEEPILYYYEIKFNTLIQNDFSVKKLLKGYKNLNSTNILE